MDETFDLINDAANFTSAGTSQLYLNTSGGVEKFEIENLSEMDSDFEHSDLGKLYAEFPENFNKIQKIRFKDKFFFNCYFNTNDSIDILKFDEKGTLIGE